MWSMILFLLSILFLSLFAPVLSPHDPMKIQLDLRLQGTSAEFPLGTDAMGRCVLSRLIYGCLVTPVAALSVVLF